MNCYHNNVSEREYVCSTVKKKTSSASQCKIHIQKTLLYSESCDCGIRKHPGKGVFEA